MASSVEYHDRFIECADDELRIRGYYFPWGTKHIPYTAIRAVRRVDMGLASGRGRIWGTADPRYWASFDPRRPTKRVALVLELGHFVHPFLTPDDPDAVEALIREHAQLSPDAGGASSPRIV